MAPIAQINLLGFPWHFEFNASKITYCNNQHVTFGLFTKFVCFIMYRTSRNAVLMFTIRFILII